MYDFANVKDCIFPFGERPARGGKGRAKVGQEPSQSPASAPARTGAEVIMVGHRTGDGSPKARQMFLKRLAKGRAKGGGKVYRKGEFAYDNCRYRKQASPCRSRASRAIKRLLAKSWEGLGRDPRGVGDHGPLMILPCPRGISHTRTSRGPPYGPEKGRFSPGHSTPATPSACPPSGRAFHSDSILSCPLDTLAGGSVKGFSLAVRAASW